ncbi:uncharacterized protein NECHADRAFT_93333 [Fusarium vanettenii 77-13-4]|uniref:AT hook domain-containing protein n=1 Tax=Fusarium vanettenii (strain ATCC MYA-4622 / CBS 123669 / FGSC 9596 / NRRL 45880 / 77-13-4) TaxID=660122 RepID=C7Z0Z3_FUSV7|nr:uncharacterized protein NECHADRAFT_93333 [Fusarium vanettenii 77-13-4]EEU42472.1 hypothetical protein NECHADRAFT_93333 [Fusarium vanettenii 77-13-4]
MPPIIILDSDDDEDHSYSPPPRGPISPAGAEAATTRTYVPEGTTRSYNQDQLSSSEMTAPAPFKRTVTGLVEPSSLASVTDRTGAKGQKAQYGNTPDEFTQASTPGRKKAPTAVMDDPWDVPSSPEVGQRRPKTKIRIKRREPQQTLGSTSKTTWDLLNTKSGRNPDPVHDGLEISPSGRRKRRKVDYPETSLQGSNEVDLVTIPFSNDNEGRESQPAPTPSMLPPTLPVMDDVSFYIAPKPLTETQKMEYESVHMPSSDSLNQPLPPIYQFNIQNIGSSDEATNVNTPRSIGTCLMSTAPMPSTAPVPSSMMDPLRMATGQSVGLRWDSSPDVIAGGESPPREKQPRQRERQRRESPAEPVVDEVPEPTRVDQPKLPAVEETRAQSLRGRPKKKAAAEEAQPVDQPEATPVTKPKKKRGRPRKAGQPATETKEASPQVEQLSVGNAVPSAKVTKRSKAKLETQHQVEEVKIDDEQEEESKEAMDSRDDKAVLQESKPNVINKTGPSEDEPSKPPEDTATPRKEEKEEKPAVSSKTTTPSRGLSAILNKPVYRVGLSKRSRIAPLLKCLRK